MSSRGMHDILTTAEILEAVPSQDKARLDYMDDPDMAVIIRFGENDEGEWGYFVGSYWFKQFRAAVDHAMGTT